MSVTRYVIVPAVDAEDNYAMLNQSLSNSFAKVRKSTDGSKYLFSFVTDKVTDQPPSEFLPYQVYCCEDLPGVLDSEWEPSV